MCRQACVCPSIIVLLLSQQKQLQTKFVLEECKHQSLVSPGKGKKTEKSQSGNVQRGFEKKKKKEDVVQPMGRIYRVRRGK